jgi:hypothetical protein
VTASTTRACTQTLLDAHKTCRSYSYLVRLFEYKVVAAISTSPMGYGGERNQLLAGRRHVAERVERSPDLASSAIGGS